MPSSLPQVEGDGGGLTPSSPLAVQGAGGSLSPSAPPSAQGAGGSLSPSAPPTVNSYAAPTAGAQAAAVLAATVPFVGLTDLIRFTAVSSGVSGNEISVTSDPSYEDPGGDDPSAELNAVLTDGTSITIDWTSKDLALQASAVVNAINNDAQASALITATLLTDGPLSTNSASVNLSGGVDRNLVAPPTIQSAGGAITPSSPPKPQS